MSLNEEIRRDTTVGERQDVGGSPILETANHSTATSPDLALKRGTPDQSGVSPQRLVVDTPQPAVKSDITERQAVEVRPMRFVLLIGLGLAIVAMLVVWLLFR